MFTLTINKSIYKKDLTSLVGKMVVIKENTNINLLDLSKMLDVIQIDKLHIYSVNRSDVYDGINIVRIKEPSSVDYIEIGIENFSKHLNNPEVNFLDYNKNALYILRNGSYIDVKKILTKISGYDVKVGRGGGQKSHMVSPLDLRLSCYLMALYNLDYKLVSELNAFNAIGKDRYLLYHV